MKLVNYRPTVPAVAQDTPHAEAPTVARAAPTRHPRLPRDAHIQFTTNPTELYLAMTIRKPEHIKALIETLQMYAPQLEYGRQREED